MNEEDQPVVETQEESHAGVLIDNNTGEEAEPTPITVGGIGDTPAPADDEAEDVETPETPAEDAPTGDTPPTPAPEAPAPQAAPAPPQKVEDPGDFTPGDYAFDVELADGTKLRIESPEDIEKIPQDADFGSPKNFLDVQAKYSRMVTGIEADKRDYETKQKEYESHQAAVEQEETMLTTWESELGYLEAKGVLPKVDPKFDNADWTSPEVANQPGVKERVELFAFMSKENAARDAAGLPRVKSVLEAQGLMERDALKTQKAEHEQKQVDMRKKRGAMVAGQSAPAPNKGNSDMIVGSGGSLRDI